jgi:hypothetical protein
MRVAALLGVLAALAGAAPAAASEARFLSTSFEVRAEPGEANRVGLRAADDGRLEVTDAAGLRAGDGCSQIDERTARCEMPGSQILVVLATDAADAAPNELRVGEGVAVPVAALGGAGADTLYGGPAGDRLAGGAGGDVLLGGPGSDELDGGAGDDMLRGETMPGLSPPLPEGEAGADQLEGGAGEDDLEGGPGGDAISGGSERDRLSYAQHASGVRVRMGGLTSFGTGIAPPYTDHSLLGVEVVIGSPFADVIQGTDQDDEVHGGGGDDRITGAGGADLLAGDDGDDRIFGDMPDPDAAGEQPGRTGGPDDLRGGAGDDLLRGDAGLDRLSGESGADVLDAREAQPSSEGRDEVVSCGEGVDRATLDWNDEGPDCESLIQPPPPRVLQVSDDLLAPGLAAQPALGPPRAARGIVRAAVHCAAAAACTGRMRVREVRQGRARGRARSRGGRLLVSRAVVVPAGTTASVRLPLPAAARARVRRGTLTRASVELRLGTRRWTRPLSLTRASLARR